MAELDRRVRRTRRLLQEALVALIEERGYERLTVQEVLDRADVGRSTFYSHFRDKDSLFMSCFDDLRDDLRSELDAITEGHAGPAGARPVAVIFAHADRNRPVYRAVCGRAGGTAFTHRLQRLFAGLLHEHLASAGTRLPVELVAEFHAGALLGALVWWVRQDFPYGPKEMAEMCRQLTAAGVQAGLEREHN
ncbi:TetR family transcriptional regulator [Amorphoplanes nipponensis]|uniref:TetR family transcriptional regulator n=2 Tax=Actinoplanes nipponensis TaxID=135950 RepID=A0A919JD56_9ACTN|nr:TetR/AcrR family transcriptional regulator [Actinoplanes nipponensis]GIE46722.1 TetR family transcriptional regulator [Actinoplanes nipponensis]